jgi:hypothetical protein
MLEAREGWKKFVLRRLKECGISLPVPSSHPDFWFFVASQLAFDFVPEFERKRGAPRKWNEERESNLIQAVKRLRPLSQKSACNKLAKSVDFKGINADTLYRRLHMAKLKTRKPKYSELARILAGIETLEPDTAD